MVLTKAKKEEKHQSMIDNLLLRLSLPADYALNRNLYSKKRIISDADLYIGLYLLFIAFDRLKDDTYCCQYSKYAL